MNQQVKYFLLKLIVLMTVFCWEGAPFFATHAEANAGSHLKIPKLAAETLPLISKSCPNVSDNAIKASLTAYEAAKTKGLDEKGILTIVDFSQPEYKRRFCTVSLSQHAVLFNEMVTHGVGSGDVMANSFSSQINSHKSMLGLYLTGDPYVGKAGFSLKLYGLDKGLNDTAAERHVVVHGTPHVNDFVANETHKIGHSLGCFGLDATVAKEVIKNLAGGTLIFAYYPSKELTTHSVFLQQEKIMPVMFSLQV